ncbi:MAG: lecithin retinol acyltransferase family protein [Cyanobacteria bacterium P01_A01_bin.105]
MARGDQVYAIREVMGVPYEHHGIDLGDGTIIHYRKVGEAEISCTSVAAFARGGPIYVIPQATAFIPEVVVKRARGRLGEKDYNLFFNNCEHFANWCKTGRNESRQLSGFGLRLDQIRLPQVGDLANQMARDESPAAALELFQQALGNLNVALQLLLPQYSDLKKEMDSWQQVAQTALERGREDLARAALHKKIEAQKQAEQLKQQLNEVSELQLKIEQDQAIAQKRLSESV